MTLPLILYNYTLRVNGSPTRISKLRTGIDQPQKQEEASDAPEDDTDDCAGRGTAIDAAIGRGDYLRVGLSGYEVQETGWEEWW